MIWAYAPFAIWNWKQFLTYFYIAQRPGRSGQKFWSGGELCGSVLQTYMTFSIGGLRTSLNMWRKAVGKCVFMLSFGASGLREVMSFLGTKSMRGGY